MSAKELEEIKNAAQIKNVFKSIRSQEMTASEEFGLSE